MHPLFAAFRIAVAAVRWTWLFGWALWRWLVPLWRFRDASRGTPEQRVANYRYNREQRGYLLPCLRRWIVVGGLFLVMIGELERHLAAQPLDTAWRSLTLTMIASAGVGFSVAVVIFLVLLVCWVWLAHDP
ncbi:MAG: hypothetical protein U1F48_05355 [Burkholderiales bacterium]